MIWKETLDWNDNTLKDIRFVGFAYIKEGHYETALKIFEGLLVLSEDNPYDLKTLGALHLQVGNPLLALQYLDKSLKKDPSDLQVQLNRTKALLTLGYRKQGISEARRLSYSSDETIAKSARALLLAFPAQRLI